MRLTQAFEVVRGDVVAFIGAGGKTSLMIGLGYELAEAGWRVLATTTTKMSREQLALFPCTMSYSADASAISQALSKHHFVLLHDQIQRGGVYGPTVEWTRQLLDTVDSDILLVEADDAAGLPFKAPLAGEPAIPLETTLVVSVASLSALGVPLDADHVYNPAAMIDKYGFVENSPVKSPWLAQVMRDDELGLQGVPAEARVIVFLNQTPERGYVRGRARMIARLSLQSERISAVALGSVRGVEPVYELRRPVAALVMTPEQNGVNEPGDASHAHEKVESVVARIAEQLIRSRMDHIRVIGDQRFPLIRTAVKHLGIKVVQNRAFRTGGIIGALKAGLRSLPAHVSAILLIQPQHQGLQPKVTYLLTSAYAQGEGDFLIPHGNSDCGHSILIGRRFWPEILKMPRHSNLTDIINHFAQEISYLDVNSETIFHESDDAPDKHFERRRPRMKHRSD